MTTHASKRPRPVARPITHPVTLSTVCRIRRGYGQFGGNWEPTVTGISSDISAPGTVHPRRAR